MVRATIMDSTVRVYHGPHEVAVHPICAGCRRRVIDPAHFAGLTGFRPSRASELALSPIAPPAPTLLRPLGEHEAVVGGSVGREPAFPAARVVGRRDCSWTVASPS